MAQNTVPKPVAPLSTVRELAREAENNRFRAEKAEAELAELRKHAESLVKYPWAGIDDKDGHGIVCNFCRARYKVGENPWHRSSCPFAAYRARYPEE